MNRGLSGNCCIGPATDRPTRFCHANAAKSQPAAVSITTGAAQTESGGDDARARSLARSLARLKKNFNGHRIPDALLKVISHSPKGQDTRRSVVPPPPPSPLIRFLATFPIFSSSFENDPSFVRESLFLLRVLSRKSKRETESKRDWKSAWLEFSR